MAQVFRSKIDAWLLLAVMAPVVIIVAVIASGSRGNVVLSPGTRLLLVIPLLITLALPLWTFLGTTYTVGDGNLTVRCGPVRRVVPLRSITRIADTRSMESAPALSLDRIAINYSGGRVVISPREKGKFLEALEQGGAGAHLRAMGRTT